MEEKESQSQSELERAEVLLDDAQELLQMANRSLEVRLFTFSGRNALA